MLKYNMYITRKCYSIRKVKVSSTKVVSVLLKFIELMIFTFCTIYLHCKRKNFPLGEYLDTRRNINNFTKQCTARKYI